jgi:hypothetical protein
VIRAQRTSQIARVPGEHTSRGGGYHYYPPLDQVAARVRDAGLQVIEDGHSEGDGYGYYHLFEAHRMPASFRPRD